MALPRLPYVVVDANQLREATTMSALLGEYRACGQRIMLPWVHPFEQSKGSADWWDKVHEHLRAEPAAVSIAYPSFVIAGRERETRKAQFGAKLIADPDNTAFLREYLADPRPTSDISKLHAEAEKRFRRFHSPDWTRYVDEGTRFDSADEEKAIRRGVQNGDRTALQESLVGYKRLGRLGEPSGTC